MQQEGSPLPTALQKGSIMSTAALKVPKKQQGSTARMAAVDRQADTGKSQHRVGLPEMMQKHQEGEHGGLSLLK